ncbi:hypothetical protein DFP73DRAFT_636416 [Morchella snyderi]|nr:hypothetical protein DFP73DRAFT_636416 [Morchella snyderi]
MLLPVCVCAVVTLAKHVKQQLPTHCMVAGNPDMYGLGIRIGIYLQLLTSAFVDSFGSQDHRSALGPVNLYFLMAIFTAMMISMWTNNFDIVGGYIVLSLGNGITMTLLGATIKLDPRKIKEGSLAAVSRLVSWAMWKCCGAIFWWYLLDHSRTAYAPSCTRLGWIFGPIELSGWFQTFHKVLNTAEWTVWLVGVLPYLFGIYLLLSFLIGFESYEWHGQRVSKLLLFCDYLFVPIGEIDEIVFGDYTETSSTTQSHNVTDNLNILQDSDAMRGRLIRHMMNRYKVPMNAQQEVPPTRATFTHVVSIRNKLLEATEWAGLRNFPLLFICDCAVLIFTVFTVELTIVLNGVKGVNELGSSGQLIAFVVGLGGALSALGQGYVDRRLYTTESLWRASVS